MKRFSNFLIVLAALAAFGLVVRSNRAHPPVLADQSKVDELQRIAQACPWQLAPPSAEAADRWLATLTSIDAGPSNVYCAAYANLPAELETKFDGYCYKTCASSACVPDCSKDFLPQIRKGPVNSTDGGLFLQLPSVYPLPMGPDKCVVVMPLDGGQLTVNVYQVTAPNPYAGPSF